MLSSMSRAAGRRVDGQDGSMVLALLASIIIGGLIVTVVATTMTGQRATRGDRDYQTAINGADAAVQQAYSIISRIGEDDDPACASGSVPAATCVLTDEHLALATELGDGQSFSWTAEQITPVRWQIRGSGFVNGVERVVEAEAAQDAIFQVGAFADIGFRMNGSNFVRAYNASQSNTGNGSIGSNGLIRINGNSRADIINLFGPNARCENSCGGSTTSTGTTVETGFSEVFDVDAIEDAIRESMSTACPSPTLPSYTSTADGPLQGGQTYCLQSIDLPNRAELRLSSDASSGNPVIVYVRGDVTIGNHSEINCSAGCGAETDRPDSGALQIYTLGERFQIGNQSQVAFAAAAPAATCQGSPSNAQATIYGALVCNDLTNQGGWDFHFDERLAGIGAGEFRITDWREEAPGTSSFG